MVSGNNALLIGDSSNVGSVSFDATAASSAHRLSLLVPLYNTPASRFLRALLPT
jgi:hypothetical protein